ncbi:MAG: helix-turn-helix domain-containing protein [Verrucomicrobiota bacterium]
MLAHHNTKFIDQNFIHIMNSYQHLHVFERRAIADLFKAGLSRRSIARRIHRSPSTVSRELKRNSSSDSAYQWQDAQQRSLQRRHSSRLKLKGLLANTVIHNLKLGFSPNQISMNFPNFGLSAQTIYSFIWRDYAQRGKLWTHLRYCGKGRHCRSYKNKRGSTKARISRHKDHSIDLRPNSI